MVSFKSIYSSIQKSYELNVKICFKNTRISAGSRFNDPE
jgi:hypothetical protein